MPDMHTPPQGQTAVPTSLRRRPLLWAGLLLAILAVLASTAYWWLSGRFYESTDDAYVGGNVTVISPRVSGYIAKLYVRDNAYVHAGEPLVALDPADFDARRAAARAHIEAAQAAIVRLQAQYALAQATVTQTQAEQQVKQAALSFAEQDAQRFSHLAATQAGTLQDAQSSAARRKQAEAQYRAATAAFTASQRQLVVIQAQTREATAERMQAEAQWHEASLDVGYTVIRAPVDGYVGNRSANVGTFVAAGSQLMSLVPANGLWVDANFKEDQLGQMHVGQSVRMVADVNTGLRITGHVASLSPATGAVFSVIPAQNATGNFTRIVQRVPVRIALDGAFADVGALRPGLSVTATVDTHPSGQ
jgi:membrane fusion protein (multidrug efflux system)